MEIGAACTCRRDSSQRYTAGRVDCFPVGRAGNIYNLSNERDQNAFQFFERINFPNLL